MSRPLLACVLLVLGACAAPPPRGWYRAAGAPQGPGPGAYVEQGPALQLTARCQGVYENEVDGRRIATVHVQLEVARTGASELRLPRAALAVDVRPARGGPRERHALSEAWCGSEPAGDDLVVPGWTRRPFDLFFDGAGLLAGGAPSSVLLRWEAVVDGAPLPGQCEFTLLPDEAPDSPAALPPADPAFGYRDGWYLPGVTPGRRGLRTRGEQRLHHVFHEPRGWLW